MATNPIPKCKAPGCGKDLPPYAGVGRRPEYCNGTCRMRAWRVRNANYEPAGPVPLSGFVPEDPVAAVATGRLAASDEQAARALMDAQNLVSVFRRLGRTARPALAWRFKQMADALTAELEELWHA
jgi:hypothetical protein